MWAINHDVIRRWLSKALIPLEHVPSQLNAVSFDQMPCGTAMLSLTLNIRVLQLPAQSHRQPPPPPCASAALHAAQKRASRMSNPSLTEPCVGKEAKCAWEVSIRMSHTGLTEPICLTWADESWMRGRLWCQLLQASHGRGSWDCAPNKTGHFWFQKKDFLFTIDFGHRILRQDIFEGNNPKVNNGSCGHCCCGRPNEVPEV